LINTIDKNKEKKTIPCSIPRRRRRNAEKKKVVQKECTNSLTRVSTNGQGKREEKKEKNPALSSMSN